MSNKKYIIMIIVGSLVVFLIGVIVMNIVMSKQEKAKEEVANKWPDLTEYDIPNLKMGKDIEIKNESYSNGYMLNYEFKIEDVKKEDLENYYNSFSDNWTRSESNSKQIFSKTESGYQYVVVFEYNEDEKNVNIYISSIYQ